MCLPRNFAPLIFVWLRIIIIKHSVLLFPPFSNTAKTWFLTFKCKLFTSHVHVQVQTYFSVDWSVKNKYSHQKI